jgi:hypothetical protein
MTTIRVTTNGIAMRMIRTGTPASSSFFTQVSPGRLSGRCL